jgi:FlaA1/EpsC-like NDP-sugar epimerase
MSAVKSVRWPFAIPAAIGFAPISQRNLFISLMDAGLAAASMIIAFYLRLGSDFISSDRLSLVLVDALMFGCLFGVAVVVAGIPKRLLCHVTIDDLVRIATVSALSIFVFYLATFTVNRLDDVPRSIPALHWLLLLMLAGGTRAAVRLWFYGQYGKRLPANGECASVPVAVIGTGLQASMFIRTAKYSGFVPYRPVAVFATDERDVGRLIDNVPICGAIDEIERHLEKLDLAGIKPRWLVVCEDLPSTVVGALVKKAEEAGIRVAKSPQLIRLAQDSDDSDQLTLQPIELEDLLGRPPAKLDLAAIDSLLRRKKILITGAGGSIGSELCRMVANCAPSSLVILDACEFNLYTIDKELRSAYPGLRISTVLADIRRRPVMMRHFENHRPNIVFHAAALKHVPMVEDNPLEGIETNVIGTKNVVDSAVASGAQSMIMVSTDKAVAPTNVMGATKRVAEYYCQSHSEVDDRKQQTRLITVRFGNVLGSSGSVVPLFQQQIAMGGPLTVTHPDIKRYFMTIKEAVGLVLQAATCILNSPDLVRGVAVLDMGEPVKIYDLACTIARLSGLEPGKDIEIKSVGLRPGEKLFEELFAPDETLVPIDANGINMAISAPPDRAVLDQKLMELQEAIHTRNSALALETLASIVPGYRPVTAPAAKAIVAA